MTYLEAIIEFDKWVIENPGMLSATEQLLFRLLLSKWNYARRAKTFKVSDAKLRDMANVSLPTLIKAKKKLTLLNLISVKKSPNSASTYSLICFWNREKNEDFDINNIDGDDKEFLGSKSNNLTSHLIYKKNIKSDCKSPDTSTFSDDNASDNDDRLKEMKWAEWAAKYYPRIFKNLVMPTASEITEITTMFADNPHDFDRLVSDIENYGDIGKYYSFFRTLKKFARYDYFRK